MDLVEIQAGMVAVYVGVQEVPEHLGQSAGYCVSGEQLLWRD